MSIFGDNSVQQPMHYGEVSGVWGYLFTTKALYAQYQIYLNNAGDPDLRRYIEDALKSKKDEILKLENLLKANGISLPPSPPDRPVASLESIPPGARMNDYEVAGAMTRDLSLGLVACSSVMGQCLREDIAVLFGTFHMNKARLGARLLRLNKEKGWVVLPPMHMQTPEHAHVK